MGGVRSDLGSNAGRRRQRGVEAPPAAAGLTELVARGQPVVVGGAGLQLRERGRDRRGTCARSGTARARGRAVRRLGPVLELVARGEPFWIDRAGEAGGRG